MQASKRRSERGNPHASLSCASRPSRLAGVRPSAQTLGLTIDHATFLVYRATAMSSRTRHLLPLFTSLLIAACATPSEMRAQKPALVQQSTEGAKTVAVCIANAWENSGFAGSTPAVNMRPTTTGYTVSLLDVGFGRTQLLADIDESLKGSTTRYFKHLIIGEAAFDAAVVSCQKSTSAK